MNQRIEKLGEEADLLGEFTPTKIPGRYVGYITEEQIKKFSELIIQECNNIVLTTTVEGGAELLRGTIATRIQNTLGVEK